MNNYSEMYINKLKLDLTNTELLLQNSIRYFDESAFESIVEKIVVVNQNELEFHMIGGLKFKEKIC